MPTVEIHGRKDVDVPGVLDITGYVTDLSWRSMLQSPWETISLTLGLPLQQWLQLLPGQATSVGNIATTGFWVVIRSPNSDEEMSAVAWGRATSVTPRMAVDNATGHIHCQGVHIQCESWLSTLAKSRLIFAVSANAWGKEGFVYKSQTWGRAFAALATAAKGQTPGPSFALIWQTIVKVLLPDTLCGNGKVIGTQIPLVHDADTTQTRAPMRSGQHLDVPGTAINALASTLPSATVWQFLAGTFQADPRLVELFPSLEFPSALKTSSSGKYVGTPKYTDAGNALQAQPVLIYRLKPWLLQPISKDTMVAIGNDSFTSQKTASESTGQFQSRIAKEPAARECTWYEFPANEIRGLPSLVLSDDNDRCNSIAVLPTYLPDSQSAGMYGSIVTPLVDPDDIESNGLRHEDVTWPFFPTTLTDKADFKQALQALTELAWNYIAHGDRYAHGAISTIYKPWCKPGNWATFRLVDAVTDPKTPGADHGGWILSAYIESVAPWIRRGMTPDDVQTGMDIQFSRGTLSQSEGYYVTVNTAGSVAASPPVSVVFKAAQAPAAPSGTPAKDWTGTAERMVKQVLDGGPTPHYTWKALLSGNVWTEVHIGPAVFKPAKIRLNLMLVAKTLEIIGNELGNGHWPVLTPNGGLNGAVQDNNPAYPNKRKITSPHRRGIAADITLVGYTPAQLKAGIEGLRAAGKLPQGRVYIYPTEPFTHVDLQIGKYVPKDNGADAGETA